MKTPNIHEIGEPTSPKHRPQKSLQMLGSVSVKIQVGSRLFTDPPNGAIWPDINLVRFLLLFHCLVYPVIWICCQKPLEINLISYV